MSDLAEMLGQAAARRQAQERKSKPPSVTVEARAMDLQERLRMFNEERSFEVGQLITQIPELSVYHWPEIGYPAIVMEVLDEPVASSPDDGNMKRVFDIAIGVIHDDGEFLCYLVDSRRFKAWDQ